VRQVRWMIATVLLLSSSFAGANECVAPKPVKISGALCGRLVDATGASVPDIKLEVVDGSSFMIADAQADSKGDFAFSRLPKGNYRLKATSNNWLIEFGDFEIKSPRGSCTKPVTVRLDTSCCCFGSGIINRRPLGY
jgi:hypothetical protein